MTYPKHNADQINKQWTLHTISTPLGLSVVKYPFNYTAAMDLGGRRTAITDRCIRLSL